MKLIKNIYGVSHIVGFILVFAITSAIVTAAILSTSMLIDQRTKVAGKIKAEALADRIADAVMEAVLVKENYPYVNYSRIMDLPEHLAGRSYYIEVTDHAIFVNSTDDLISGNSTSYNLEELNMGLSGRVDGSARKIKIFCNRTDYVYRFDFDNNSNNDGYVGHYGYTRVTCDYSTDPTINWYDDKSWRCRTPIYIENADAISLTDIQIKISLSPYYFDYSNVNRNASDIRFTSSNSQTEFDYWIQEWNYYGSSTIWVEIDDP
jgi:hypothetical protein